MPAKLTVLRGKRVGAELALDGKAVFDLGSASTAVFQFDDSGVAAAGGPLAAAIGPGIGPCCYEVGDEVAAPFKARFGDDVMHGRNLDLAKAIERGLRAAGVESVGRTGHCTSCEPELFFSHRRDRGRTGRQGVLAFIR